MAQILINIPDFLYKQILKKHVSKATIARTFQNGVVLPKGHERIIDTDIIKDFKNKIKHYEKDYRFTQEEILNILERYEIKYASTIIEADKEET